ncbi:serine-rich adhesin for platelets [Bactrocera tryoni]|uniref:serine-rich adhesin for platelets n=1 Tax=Bactrocera tryoni TaxID=59916 RepID=UPI001A97CC2A|nr:serine-rich adhesin for platelets [Bactrocera tryoni]
MDLDDLDIYEDLDTFQQDEEKKTAELLSLEAKYNDSLKTIETLQLENADLKKQIRRIGINFQNLLDTAKAEIKRKDKQIEQLRKEKDDICFRRKQPRREYTDVASTSQNTNTWFKSEIPTANTNENAQITSKNVEAIDNEQPSATSYNTRGREITHEPDDYKKQERRNESLERKYDSDPTREKYNRSNNQREQHVSRYNARSTERAGNFRNATRDYSRSHDSRTVDRGHNIKNKNFYSETEKESYNSTDDRRQHSYDRLGDRSRYHGKEEKTKSESYDGRHDRRSDNKEARTKSDSSDARYDRRSDSKGARFKSESSDARHDRRSDGKEARLKSESSDVRHDRRSDSKRHHEDAIKKSKETNEKACDKVMNSNRDKTVTYAKNSDGLTQSKDIRGKTPNPFKDGRREDKLIENPKFSERTHEDTKNMQIGGDFLDKHLPASKDSQSLEKLPAEQKLTKEKLIALENEFSCKETDKNANRLLSADGMTTPKKTTLFDELFGNTPTNAGDVNSNVIDFRKGSGSSATTSPSNYTDTSEPTIISSTVNSKKTDTNDYYIPIKGEQNRQNKNDVSLVTNSDNGCLAGKQLISSLTSKNQAANENSAEKSVTCVKTNEETVDYAKIATILLSEDEEETEIEQAAETHEDESVKNEAKTNGNKINGGIQILSNIRLPNIYEIRAHQRRLRELAAAKKAKRGKIAETNNIKQNAAQNITEVVVPVLELLTKGIQKNSTTTTTVAKNNEGVDLEEESIEAKIQQDKNTHKNSSQLSAGISADTNAIMLNNEITTEVSSSDATKIADRQSIENLKLVNKNVTPPLEANTEATHNDKTVADESIRSNNTEKSGEVLNETEGISEIATAEATEKVVQIATAKTILTNTISDALETVELIVEEAVVPNETKSTHTAIKTVITSAVSPATNINNEKNESGGLSLSPTTVTNTPNNDMPDMDLLTDLLPDVSEKSIVECIENIKETQEFDESNNGISQTNKASENIAAMSLLEEDSTQLKACGENTNNLLQNTPMDIEEKESCKQNAIAQQKEIEEQNIDITDEENLQATEKLIEAVNTANKTTIEVKVASENAVSNCDSMLGEEKSEENNYKTHELITEQKPIARSEVATQKVVPESAEYTSEELLDSTDTTNESSSETEIGKTKNTEVMVPDATNPIINETERSADWIRNLFDKSESTLPNGISEETANSENTTENGSDPVREKLESTKRISEETAIAENTTENGSDPVREKLECANRNGISEETAIAENMTENGSDPVREKLESANRNGISEETAIAESVSGPVIEKSQSTKRNSTSEEFSSAQITAESGSDLFNDKSESTELNSISEEFSIAESTPSSGSGPITEETEGTKHIGSSEESAIAEGTTVVDENDLCETEAAVSYLINNMDKPTNSFIDGNEKITEVQNVLNIETKNAVESKVVEKQPKAVDNQRNKNPKSKAKELPNTVNITPERNVVIENMKRSEVLWKFKIPKISAKRKREESVDGSSAKESKNAGTDVVKKEKHSIKAEEPIIPYKKKKNEKLTPKHMPEETKMLEINGNIDKNLLETKTLFENQKKSERIIKEIDNWARRKVGETTEIFETENQIEYIQAPKVSTNKHDETVKKTHSKDEIHTVQKTDEHKAHKDKNSESTTIDVKCNTAKQRDHNKPPTEERSTRERSSEKRDQTQMLKGQNTKIQERRKSQPKVEHDEHSQGTKYRNGKHDVGIHKEKSQESDEMAAKCGQRIVTKAQRGELKTLKVDISVKANNTVKNALGSHEFEEKSKNSSDSNLQNENAVKKAHESLKFSTKEHITSKSQVAVAAVSCEINNVKCDISKEPAADLKQKKVSHKNYLVAKKKSTEQELNEKDADNHVKRAKSDIGGGKKENLQKLTVKELTTTEEMQVVSDCHTKTTNDHQRIATEFNQTPKRRKTSTSSDDSEVMSKSQRRKRFRMRIEDSDDDDEYATHSSPTAVPEPTESLVDVARKNKDIIDILQNDRASESNDNLPAPQTPTSLPMNVSQDAEYEEIDSRLQLMFASPKIANKTSSNNSLAVANQLKTQLLQSNLQDSAIVEAVTGTVSPKIADKTSSTDQLVIETPIKQPILEDRAVVMGLTSPKPAHKASSAQPVVANPIKSQLTQPILDEHAVVTDMTGTEAPIGIDLPLTASPVGDAKPPADFNVTDSFLSDITANSFLAADMNVTIEETNHTNTSLSDSSLSTKHISLGSSDYRFEKVSENVVNLFITRKRRGKRKPTATITTNTVSAT